jgi:kynurenine formamidase
MHKSSKKALALRPIRTGMAAALAVLLVGCAGTPPAGHSAAAANAGAPASGFIAALKSARLIDLSHTWEPQSPVASVNPRYSYALSATHAKTRGTFQDDGQLSFAAEKMEWSGQHGAPSIDALGHIGRDGKLFGGIDAAGATSHQDGIGAGGVGGNLGIDQFPTELIVNRGVLLDVASVVMNGNAPLPPDFEITDSHLELAASRHGVRLQPGDTVFIRTGWGQYFKGDPKLYAGESSPGPGIHAAEYLIRHGVRVVGNDTLTFEKRPAFVSSPKIQVFPVHMRLIADSGIYIVENLNLEELAAARVYEFAVVVPPLKVKGATGSALRIFALAPR